MTPIVTIAELHRIAAAYPPDAAFTPSEERERFFTDAQRVAWDMRFAGIRPSNLSGRPAPMEAL